MRTLQAARRLRGPIKLDRKHLKCWKTGIKDGWNQPYDLSTSTSVDWIVGRADDYETRWQLQESLDRGTCVGQFLRSPLHCEKYWKDPWDR